jgi:hypothetical protein
VRIASCLTQTLDPVPEIGVLGYGLRDGVCAVAAACLM